MKQYSEYVEVNSEHLHFKLEARKYWIIYVAHCFKYKAELNYHFMYCIRDLH